MFQSLDFHWWMVTAFDWLAVAMTVIQLFHNNHSVVVDDS